MSWSDIAWPDGDEAGAAARSRAVPPRGPAIEQHLVHGQVTAVQRAPDDEGPVGAVPQPAEQHRQHQVAVGLADAAARLPPSGM